MYILYIYIYTCLQKKWVDICNDVSVRCILHQPLNAYILVIISFVGLDSSCEQAPSRLAARRCSRLGRLLGINWGLHGPTVDASAQSELGEKHVDARYRNWTHGSRWQRGKLLIRIPSGNFKTPVATLRFQAWLWNITLSVALKPYTPWLKGPQKEVWKTNPCKTERINWVLNRVSGKNLTTFLVKLAKLDNFWVSLSKRHGLSI